MRDERKGFSRERERERKREEGRKEGKERERKNNGEARDEMHQACGSGFVRPAPSVFLSFSGVHRTHSSYSPIAFGNFPEELFEKGKEKVRLRASRRVRIRTNGMCKAVLVHSRLSSTPSSFRSEVLEKMKLTIDRLHTYRKYWIINEIQKIVDIEKSRSKSSIDENEKTGRRKESVGCAMNYPTHCMYMYCSSHCVRFPGKCYLPALKNSTAAVSVTKMTSNVRGIF